VVGRWIGWVTDVRADSFWAEVEDLLWGAVPHQVELPLTLVSDYDIPLFRENAVFYWIVGYRHRSGGTRVQEATVRFRRTPKDEPWMEDRVKEWTAEMRRALDEVASD
jgi:hypothetical protein